MIVCPVCEHPQAQGSECEVCGKQLARAPAPAAPVAPLPEIERTAFTAAPELPGVALDGLETTGWKSGPDLPAVKLVDVEPTVAPAVGEVPVQAVAELESGRWVDTGPRTQVTARVCRYCRNVQPEGLSCNRCGMMLPPVISAAGQEAAAPGRRAEAQVVKCLQCGSRVEKGEVCGGCGVVA
jgi:hypothetical protein